MRILELVSLTRDYIDKSGRIFILGKDKKERFVCMIGRAKKYFLHSLKIEKANAKALFAPLRGQNVNKKI